MREKTGDGQDTIKKDTVKESAKASRMLEQTANDSNRENSSEAEHHRKQRDSVQDRGVKR